MRQPSDLPARPRYAVPESKGSERSSFPLLSDGNVLKNNSTAGTGDGPIQKRSIWIGISRCKKRQGSFS
jgi:hypothetical protein